MVFSGKREIQSGNPPERERLIADLAPPPPQPKGSPSTTVTPKNCFSIATPLFLLHLKNKFTITNYVEVLYKLRFATILVWLLAGGVSAAFFMQFISDCSQEFEAPEGTPAYDASKKMHTYFPSFIDTMDLAVFIESFAPEGVLLTDMNKSTTRCVSEFLSEVGRRLSEKTNSSSRKNSFADDLESFQSYYSLKSIGVDSLAARLMDSKTQRRTIAPVRLWGQFASKEGMNRALDAESFIRRVADGFEAEAAPNVNNTNNNNNNHDGDNDGAQNDDDNSIYTRVKVTKRLESDCLATLQIVGVPLLVNEALEASAADMGKSDGIVLPIALLVMAVTVKSLRLMVLPMLTVGLSLAVSFAIMCGVTRIMTVSSAAPSLMMSLGICMSIDYCLFIVSRYVQEVRIHMKALRSASSAAVSSPVSPLLQQQQQEPTDHLEPQHQQDQQQLPDQHDLSHDLEASKLIIARVIGGAGHTIVVSGSTLILSLIALVFFPLNILQSFGWGCSLTVLTSLCVSLTLCPTLLLTFPKFFENGAKNLKYPSWVPKFLVEKILNHKEDNHDGPKPFDHYSTTKAGEIDHNHHHHEDHNHAAVVGHHYGRGQANATEQQSSSLLGAHGQPLPSLVVVTTEETLGSTMKNSNSNEDEDEENAAIKVPERYSALIANDEESSSSAVAGAAHSVVSASAPTDTTNTTNKRKQMPCAQGSADHTVRVDTKTHKDADEYDNNNNNCNNNNNHNNNQGDIAMYASIINGTIFRHLHRTMIWPYNLLAFLFTVAMAGGMGVAILLEFRITDSFELALPRGYTITESYLRLVEVFGFSYMYPYQMLLEFKPPQPTLIQNGGDHYNSNDDNNYDNGDYSFSSATSNNVEESPRGILEPFMFNFSKAAMQFVTADTDLPGGLGVGDLSGVLAFGGRWITSTEVDDCLRWFNTTSDNSDGGAFRNVRVRGGEVEETLAYLDVENNNSTDKRFPSNMSSNNTCTMELLTLLAGTVTRDRDAMLMMLFINTDPIGNEGDAFYRRLLKLAEAFLDWARGGCVLDPQSPYFASQMAAAKVLAVSHSDSAGDDDQDKYKYGDAKKITTTSGRSRIVGANSAGATPIIPPSVAKKAKLVSNQVKFYFSGIGPQSMDAVATVYRLFPIIIAVSGAVVLLVVGLSFKSVLIPLRCVLSIALTELFVFGWVALVYSLEPHGIFDWTKVPAITSYHAVTWIDPIVAFSVVLGIALDYDVFLLTRVFELRMADEREDGSDTKTSLLKPTESEYEEENQNDPPPCESESVKGTRSGQLVAEDTVAKKEQQKKRSKKNCLSTHDAILVGVCDTGPIITSAGIIMSIAFFGMLLSAMPLLNVLGMFLVTAVLFDTFVIRTLLGPSALSLLGELSWWPRKPPIVPNRL